MYPQTLSHVRNIRDAYGCRIQRRVGTEGDEEGKKYFTVERILSYHFDIQTWATVDPDPETGSQDFMDSFVESLLVLGFVSDPTCIFHNPAPGQYVAQTYEGNWYLDDFNVADNHDGTTTVTFTVRQPQDELEET